MCTIIVLITLATIYSEIPIGEKNLNLTQQILSHKQQKTYEMSHFLFPSLSVSYYSEVVEILID